MTPQAALGEMLIRGRVDQKLVDANDPAWGGVPMAIYVAMQEVEKAHGFLELTWICKELSARGWLDQVGGAAGVAALTDAVGSLQ